MEYLKALLALVRLRHTGQVVAIVSILSIKSHGISVQSVFAIISSLFLCISLFSFDDAHDYISDLIVHPERPIPRGLLTINRIYSIGAICFCLGLFFSASLMFYQFVLFLSIAVLGFCVIFLRLGPMLKAIFTASMIFMLFPFSTSISLKSVLFGLTVALPHIAGSIAKDFIHSKGDEKIGIKTPPNWARYVAGLIFFVDGGILLLPVVLNIVGWIYVPLILPTLLSCLMLGNRIFKGQYQKVYVYGGIGMVSALVAFAANI